MGRYAGLSAASYLRNNSDLVVQVIEAADYVGGRTRNFDVLSNSWDSSSDNAVEVGGWLRGWEGLSQEG